MIELKDSNRIVEDPSRDRQGAGTFPIPYSRDSVLLEYLSILHRVRFRRVLILLSVGLSGYATGCSHYIDPNVPDPIRPMVDPQLGGKYLLYRPSNYDRKYSWPLIVICHTSFADSPNRRIRDWTTLAEEEGFLVAAPKLKGVRRFRPPKPDPQRRLQRDDEDHILAAVRQIRAGYNISQDRIFLYGWSGGAYAALYTGLRHPDLFRAIALAQPKFDERYVAGIGKNIDPYQPIYIAHTLTDTLSGKHAQRCVGWLRPDVNDLVEDTNGPVTAADNDRVVAFFEDVIQHHPWIHIRAWPTAGDTGPAVRFKLRSSHPLTRFHWEFGDGEQASAGEPIHAYAADGRYHVSVTASGPDGTEYHRNALLSVPEMTLTRIARHSNE